MKKTKRLVLFSLFALNLVDQPAPEVEIDQGILSGKVSTDGSYFEYMGIPYATTNEATRFQAPGPPPKWNGVYKAIDEFYRCPQKGIGNFVHGIEDCLKINVYVPVHARKPLAVMVFIHGGAFIVGSGGKLMYGADFFMKKDVILVTFNYRLGALGFLCLGIKEAPGNAGLKDQIAALRWVRKNIRQFGGDPDNVTLFGQSAGAASASMLLASEVTEGLFQRVILQSGSSLANWAINKKPVWSASFFAKALGFDSEDPKELYKFYSNVSLQELVIAEAKKPIGDFYDTQLFHIPCIEENIPNEESVLLDLPQNVLMKKPKNIPVILGSTSKEGLFLIKVESEEMVSSRNGRYLFASDLQFKSKEEAINVAERVKKFYFGDETISLARSANLTRLYTELYFEIPFFLEYDLLVSNFKAPVFAYNFDYDGGRNFLKLLNGFTNETGACHADDLLYLFSGYIWPFKIKDQDQRIIDLMTNMWTNFAKYGDPLPRFVSDSPVKWEPNTRESLDVLRIGEKLEIRSLPNPDSYKLWKEIYKQYGNLAIL